MPITTKQYLDYQGLSTYDSLLKDYIDSANTLGIKKVIWNEKVEKIFFFKDPDATVSTEGVPSVTPDAEVAISSAAVNALNTRVGITDILNSYQSASNLTTILNVLTADDAVVGSVANLLKKAIEALDGSATIATVADGVVTIKAGVVEVDGVITNATGEGATDIVLKKVATTAKAEDINVEGKVVETAEGIVGYNLPAGTAQATAEHLASEIATVDAAVKALETASEVIVEKLAVAEEGYVASYAVKQNGAQVGATINIPKDYLVKNAELKTCTVADTPVAGYKVGDKYMDFTINVAVGSGNESHIYINVNELFDAYTSGSKVGDTVVVTVDNSTNKISADITDGTVARAKINAAFEKNITDVEATHAAAADGSGAKYKTVAEEINDKVVTLNAEKEQKANPADADGTGLALRVVEEDGKITEISGSIDTVTEAQINSLFGK